jgi:hypothetical protein
MHAMRAIRVPLPVTHAVLSPIQAPLSGGEAALIGLAALGVVMAPFLWPLVEHFNVMAHEGAHAVVGTAVGFTVDRVELNIESEGATILARPAKKGPRAALWLFVGYLGPSAFGLWAAKLIETGHVVTVLWIAVILLVLLLFVTRKSFGVLSVPAAIAALALVMRYAHSGLEEVIVYGMTWLLLLSGVRVAMSHGAGAEDARSLSTTTHIPRTIWALLWLAGTVLAVLIGGKWLVLRTG